MSRKKSPTSEMNVAEKMRFPLTRHLNELITDGRALAENLGCSIQAINQFKQGISKPSLENLCKIADFYGVSTDYLLGRTEIKSPNANVQAVAEYTGFSEETISWLNNENQEHKEYDYLNKVRVVDSLLQNRDFQKALASIISLRLFLNDQSIPTHEKGDYGKTLALLEQLRNYGRYSVETEKLYDLGRYEINKIIENALDKIVPFKKLELSSGEE